MNSRTWLDSDQHLLHKIRVCFFFKEAAFLMNLDIERTEKTLKASGQVRSGHHRRFLLGELLDWVGLGWARLGFFNLSGSHGLEWKLLYCTRGEVYKCIHTLGTVYIL